MRLIPLFLAAALVAQSPAWQQATKLDGVNLEGLTAAQRQTALQAMREGDCTCQCQMKVAECRVKDPECTDSKALGAVAVREAKAGKAAVAIRKAMDDSELARRRRAAANGDPVELKLDGAPSRGPANAKIVLVEFSDFQCPYCRVAAKHVEKLLAMYPNDLRLVFKQFPLESHSDAALAAEASLAAHAQGKFWPMHDRIFRHEGRITRAQLAGWAMEAGLDMARFNRDMNAGTYRAQVAKETQEGEAAGVQGTPAFYLNGRPYQGSVEPSVLGPVLDKALGR